MVYFLPNEFMAPANQVVQEETSPDINEDEQLGVNGTKGIGLAGHLRQTGQKSTHEVIVLERIRQWQAIDQDVC
jgi:hypothetical protein